MTKCRWELAVQTTLGYIIEKDDIECGKEKLSNFLNNLISLNERFCYLHDWSDEKVIDFEDFYEYRVKTFLYYKVNSEDIETSFGELQEFLDCMIKYHNDFTYCADYIQCRVVKEETE